MYRCRNLLFLFREKTVFGTHAQVARSGFLTSQPVSQRHFSDSANVAKPITEEETNDKVSSKKVSKAKLFSFDQLYETEKKAPAAKEKESVNPDVEQEVLSSEVEPKVLDNGSLINDGASFDNIESDELLIKIGKREKTLKDNKQRRVKDKSQLEQTSGLDESLSDLKEEQHVEKASFQNIFEDEKQISAGVVKTDKFNVEQGMDTTKVEYDMLDQGLHRNETSIDEKIENEESIEDQGKEDKSLKTNDASTNVKTEREESIEDQAKEMKTEYESIDGLRSNLLNERISDAQITKMIFAMDKPDQVLYNLGICFDEVQSTKKMMMIIVCALQKLKTMESTTVSTNLVDRLNDFLVNRSLISKIGLSSLLKILEFFIMRSSKDDRVTETLLHELCWRLRRSSLKETMDVIAMVKLRVTTTKRKEVQELANERLKEVIGETSTPKELLALMYLVQDSDTQRMVEEEALNLLQSLDCTQSFRLLNLLVKRKSSNFSLIHQVKDQLFSRPLTLEIEQLKTVFYICSSLEEQDCTYLRELSVSMLECLENTPNRVPNSTLIAVLHSCSRLGWNYKRLSNKIMEDLSNDEDLLKNQSSKTLSSIVMSICHLNLDSYGKFGSEIARHLMLDKTITPSSRLDIIKSLASIKMAEKDEVLSVLQPAFYQPMLDKLKESPKFLRNNMKSKLLRVYGYLREDLKESSPQEDTVASELRQQLQTEMDTKPSCNFAKVVSDVITRIGPLHTYTAVNVVTRYGYTIDFELFVNKSLKAVRLEQKEGAQRIWIKVLPRNAFVLEDDKVVLSPDTLMMIRHLQKEKDAAIILIDYLKWMKRSHTFDHLLYIESLIKTAVNGDTNGIELDTRKAV